MAKESRDGLYLRGTTWWIRTDPVKGIRISTGCDDRSAAKSFLAERKRIANDPSYRATQEAILNTWIGNLIDLKMRQKRSSGTIEVLIQKLGHWVRIFGETANLSVFTPAAIDEYVKQRRSEMVKDITIVKELGALTQLLAMAKRVGCWKGDIDSLKPLDLMAQYVPVTRALTFAEVEALIYESTPRLLAFVVIAVAFGCRRSEAWKVTAEDLRSLDVHIRGTKTRGSDRYVPRLSVFQSWINLIDKRLLPLRYECNLGRDLAAACARAGIERCTPNDLRRTHATMLWEIGVDRDVIRRILGHTSTALLDKTYAQPRPETIRERAELAIGSVAQKRHNEVCVGEAKTAKNAGATFRNRTGDLRFTKPISWFSGACGRAENSNICGSFEGFERTQGTPQKPGNGTISSQCPGDAHDAVLARVAQFAARLRQELRVA